MKNFDMFVVLLLLLLPLLWRVSVVACMQIQLINIRSEERARFPQRNAKKTETINKTEGGNFI